jgi:inositol oxygenase
MDVVDNKTQHGLRGYNDAQDRVVGHYTRQHRFQTLAYVDGEIQRLKRLATTAPMKMTIMEAVDSFNFFDESDPDFDKNNVHHLYQTGECCRRAFPDLDWMHLVGFLHDLGKSPMQHRGTPEWSIGGDTYPLGCKVSPHVVYSNSTTFPDETQNASECGPYPPGCGFRNVTMSYGHDEYMYRVLASHPECTIPEAGLYVIRFHSFYSWHQHKAYGHLADEFDFKILGLIQAFQQTDLYSKLDDMPSVKDLRPYYASLVEKYCPGKLEF